MPYILPKRRERFIDILATIKEKIEILDVSDEHEIKAGDLNYLITKILDSYIEVKGKNYANYNELIGMLECCKAEYYRRRVAPYEDEKIKSNGDV